MTSWTVKAPPRWPVCGLRYLSAKVLRSGLSQAEHTRRQYVVPPRLIGDAVEAEVDAEKHGRARFTITVYRRPKQVVLGMDCACGRFHCVHIMSLLLDLATWPEFAHALVTGRDTAPFMDSLDARRLGQLNRAAVENRLGSWVRAPTTKAPQALRFLVFPRWVNADWDGTPGDDSRPGLEVRALLAGRKTPLKPDELEEAPLTAADRDLLDLCVPAATTERTGLLAHGRVASVVLRALETRDVQLDGGARLRFETWRVAPRVVQRRVPPGWLKGHVDGPAPEDDDASVDALVAEWTTPDGTLVSPMTRTMFFPGQEARVMLLDRALVVPLAPGVDQGLALQLQRQPVVRLDDSVPAAAVWGALRNNWMGRGVGLPAAQDIDVAAQDARVMWLALDGSVLQLEARLVAEYAFGVFDLHPGAPVTDLRRDATQEQAAVEAVTRSGLVFDESQRVWLAEGDDAARFWETGVANLGGVDVRIAQGLTGVTVRPPVTLGARVGMTQGLLDLSLVLNAQGLAADMEDVRRALRNKRRYIRLQDGTLALLQGTARALSEEHPELLAAPSIPLPQHRMAQVHAWLQDVEDVTWAPAARAWKARVDSGPPPQTQPVTACVAQLADYQQQAVAWLQWLTWVNAGGILADDMGLGKTLVVLTWLAWLKEQGATAPALVVCPTSVTDHWLAEAARFVPSLRVQLFHGGERKRAAQTLEDVDVLVTTYGVLRQDAVWLSRQKFGALILDEAQQLKNVDAMATRVATQLPATHRVALTGTPVENRARDLWSIMELVNPGLLGPRGYFESTVEPALLAEPQGWHAQRLRKQVAPFILRRTKAQVLTQLPPKTQVDRLIMPTREQRARYDAVAALCRKDVAKALEATQSNQARMTVLAALTRLRQVAIDPRLLDEEAPAAESAKRTEFLDLVRALADEGRRTLVFSSFVELLTLWRRDLHGLGLNYGYLDGSTTARGDVVKAFQEGDAPLMLVSLKAGGAGLNLTGADTVILTDPWWNPAAEDQAADRAHRRGQSRPVTVYRLITRGTVEERMVELHQRKRGLSQALLGTGAPALDVTALQELLRDLEP